MDERLIGYQFSLLIDYSSLLLSDTWTRFDDLNHLRTNLFVINMWFKNCKGDLQTDRMCWQSPCLWTFSWTSGWLWFSKTWFWCGTCEAAQPWISWSDSDVQTQMISINNKFPPVSVTFSVCESNRGNKNTSVTHHFLSDWWHHGVRAHPWVRSECLSG